MLPDAAPTHPLPPAARRWVCDVVGADLADVVELPGATSSLVCLLTFDDRTELVLRLHTKDDWLAREPDIATREAHALQALSSSDVAAPALVAVDEAGEFCGRPAVLMSRVRGHADLSDASPARLAGIAQALRPLHALQAPSTLPAFRPHVAVDERQIPGWTSNPAAWQAAIDVCGRPAPSGPICFIHRDYHPGNVLVEGGAITGIIDWPNACAGPPEIDVAHCRVNLAFVHSVDAADTFARLVGTDPHRQAYWDLVDCLDLVGVSTRSPNTLPDDDTWLFDSLHAVGAPPLTAAAARRRLDEYVTDALRRWHER